MLAALSAIAEACPSGSRQRAWPYRGMNRHLITELANRKKANRLSDRQRRLEVRELLFGKARGRMMSLPRKQRLIVNQESHESYDRYLFRCRLRGSQPMSFNGHRRRWYGSMKACWPRWDVPRMLLRANPQTTFLSLFP